jgi:hypothetical protein
MPYTMRSLIASLLVAGCVTALAGCASTAAYEHTLNEWVGHPADRLVAKWGPPQGTYTMKTGEVVMEWVDETSYTSRITTPTTSRVTVGGQVGTIQGTQERVSEVGLWCRTTFYVDPSGTIKRWSLQGNHCVS